MSIKSLVGKKMTQKTDFMGEKINIKKLTVAEVTEIQSMAENAEGDDNFELLRFVIRAAVEDGEELEDSDFDEFPLDELTKLSNAIIKFSGVKGDPEKK